MAMQRTRTDTRWRDSPDGGLGKYTPYTPWGKAFICSQLFSRRWAQGLPRCGCMGMLGNKWPRERPLQTSSFLSHQAQCLLPSWHPSFQPHPPMASPHPTAIGVFLTHPSSPGVPQASGCCGSPGCPSFPPSFSEVVLLHPVLQPRRASLHNTGLLVHTPCWPRSPGHFLHLVPLVSSPPPLPWASPSSPRQRCLPLCSTVFPSHLL